MSGLSLQTDGTCSCNYQYYWDSGTGVCEACDPTCLFCIGTSSSQCTACISTEASLSNGVCTCKAGWYWDSGSYTCTVCDTECAQCTGPTADDCVCLENSVRVGSVCVCDVGYFMDINVCEECDSSCLSCDGTEYYQCLTCSQYLLGSVCLGTCPVGYSQNENVCVKSDDTIPNVEYVFNTIEGIYYDNYSQVPAITGINPAGYPDIDSTDPLPAYQRGLYFTGNGSYLAFPYQTTGVLLLGINFFISTWINPVALNGELFYKSNASNHLLSVMIINGYLTTKISIHGNIFEYVSTHPLLLYTWNYALISIAYTQGTSISATINLLSSSPLIATTAAFIDTVGSSLIVGASGVPDNYYNGFIYSIGIYSSYPSAEIPITQCDQCNLCQPTGICLPTCNITSFYSETIFSCIDCPTDCVNGCRNSNNCNLCNDSNCISCSTYDPTSCIVCTSGFEINIKGCVGCNSTSYYSPDTKICVSCTGLCESCDNSTFCTSCTENSQLASNNSCVCNQGYSGTGSCIRNTFIATIGLSSSNQATLYFSEALSKPLEESSITVKVNENSQDFQISEVDPSTYLVEVNFTASVNSGDTLNIALLLPLVSVDNSILTTSSLTASLFAQTYNDLVSQISTMKSYSQTGVTVGVCSALGASAINLNPTIFFNFLNSAEIYSYILMYDLDLDPSLAAFLNELQVNSQVPNAFNYFISPSNGVVFTNNLSNFAFGNSLLMVNCGNNITLFVLFGVVVILLMCFTVIKCTWLNNQLAKAIGYFQYGAFLRLWIQTFLPTTFSAFLSIQYVNLDNNVQVVDMTISCLVLVIDK